jgi:Ca2+-transporting ATPase
VIASFDINQYPWLSSEEALSRLKKEGFNEIPSKKRRNLFSIIISIILEPMFLLLIAGGVLYLCLGSRQEAIMLLSFVVFIIGITFYQERKTERALEALRDLSSPRALVIRDGVEQRIAGRDVVLGDVVILREGDCVPADAMILYGENLLIDESLLTGESVPVSKMAKIDVIDSPKPGGDDLPFVFSGTLVVRGYGVAKIHAIGANTEIGKIGKYLKAIEPEKTLLQKETNRLVQNFAYGGLFLCAIVVIVYGLTRADWVHGFLAGITLAMAILPEEFPVVLTVFLALGAWRIAQEHVLTRRVPAVEALGSATVLCVDKTGTLTLNQMSVGSLFANGEFFDVNQTKDDDVLFPENFHELLEFSILASQKDPFDPMEKAIKKLGDRYLATTEHLHYDWKLTYQYPLSSQLLALSHVWQASGRDDYVIAAKGAPESIADLCHLNELQTESVLKAVHTMAKEGLRVLGVAKAVFEKKDLPKEQHDFVFEFVGLVGLSDPIRPEVVGAIKECYSAGIRVVMMTGDYSETAQSIAKKIGLASAEQCVSGLELDQMDDEALKRIVKNASIFARIVPEQKLRLVNALKANGDIVAMTGDGINDAPALKAADIGIAMGARGTDVARESASLVLLDDNFFSIVQAIKLGRRIYDNIKKAISYILAIHVPIIGVSLIPVLFKWPLIFFPAHIVFLELIIDPACSIAFEAEPAEKNIMSRPPRNPNKPLFDRKMIFSGLFQGLCLLFAVMLVYLVALHLGRGEEEARELTFTTLVMANIALIFSNRSWAESLYQRLLIKNISLWLVILWPLLLLSIVLYVPAARHLFGFSYLPVIDLVICFIIGMLSVFAFRWMLVLL